MDLPGLIPFAGQDFYSVRFYKDDFAIHILHIALIYTTTRYNIATHKYLKHIYKSTKTCLDQYLYFVPITRIWGPCLALRYASHIIFTFVCVPHSAPPHPTLTARTRHARAGLGRALSRARAAPLAPPPPPRGRGLPR